jgi:hypothetical protein
MTVPSNKPTHVPDTSQAALRELYTQHAFATLLPTCTQEHICPKRQRRLEDTFHAGLTEHEEGIKYRHPVTKHTVAVIFWYTDSQNRVFEIIRSLRVGDTVYDAKSRPD